jgi:segregation and condensation protein B
MNELELKHIIEATLLAAGRPVTTQQLLDLFDERERPTPEQLQAAFDLLAAEYSTRGLELIEVASGWRVQVRARYAEVVSRLWQERPSRYSRALLETLALIAYRQPITRSEIEEIRGVSISSTIMRTLQERNWIRTVGHREVPGRPELLGTTREFLDYFGLKGLDQLPTLAELKDVETIGVQLELPSGDLAPEAAAADSGGEASADDGSAEPAGGDSEPSAEAAGEAGEQAELSAAGEEAELSADAAGEETELSADAAGEETELSADAAGQDEEDEPPSSTLVASSEDEQRDDEGAIGEPPADRD